MKNEEDSAELTKNVSILAILFSKKHLLFDFLVALYNFIFHQSKVCLTRTPHPLSFIFPITKIQQCNFWLTTVYSFNIWSGISLFLVPPFSPSTVFQKALSSERRRVPPGSVLRGIRLASRIASTFINTHLAGVRRDAQDTRCSYTSAQ